MPIWVWFFIGFIICQRLVELMIAKQNEQWMRERGGIEQGANHYKWFIILHILFFVSIFTEISMNGFVDLQVNYFLLFLFACTQIGRVWCIYTLGRFWNTKIIVLPGVSLIKKGPYKYVKHPNYIIVAVELLIIPMLLGAYITMIIFPILHILLLWIRIPSENKALDKKVLST